MEYRERYEAILPYTVLCTLFFFVVWKLYKSVWRYASATELINIAFASSCAPILCRRILDLVPSAHNGNPPEQFAVAA